MPSFITSSAAMKAILIFAAAIAVSSPATGQDEPRTLKDAGRPFFHVGVGVGVNIVDRTDDWELLNNQFDFVTPENCMKVQAVQPAMGEFNFENADRFVQFATDHERKVVGHCLVWAKDDRTPEWFYKDADKPASAEVLMARMKTHIETVMKRYKGRIAMWDVVNEALADSGGDYLRESGWSKATGEDFIVKAFEYAHAADPDAFLIYNDYRCDTKGKRDKLVRLITMLKSRNAPVNAIGLQGHYDLDEVPFEGLEEMFKAVRKVGYKIVVSELDIDVVKRGRWWADGNKYREELASYDPYKDKCPDEILQRQADQYAKLFKLFCKYSDVIERVSFWNLHDGRSWLNYFPWKRTNHPLLFDRQRQTKPAFDSVMAVLADASPAKTDGGKPLPAQPQADATKQRPRVLVLTDISNEPDDEESMVRFLVYANEFDIEGLVATTSTHLRDRTREDLIRRQLDAYEQVVNSLSKHAKGFPTADSLRAVTATGQPAYGMEAVGEGKSTAGSKLLLAAADKDDERPLWISVWGGANTLAQALDDARRTRSPEELNKLVGKLRVYTISDQDDAGRWLRLQFPELFYVVSPSSSDWREYYRATWTGISGDRHYKNAPMAYFELVDNPWLEQNIINNHGPLGRLYPKLEYIMEGDTPSYLGLINNGLTWTPAHGGWGGRYSWYKSYGETHPIWTDNLDNRDTIVVDGKPHTSNQATIWRWRKHFQHDFAARMDWCVADEFEKANHNPIAVVNGDTSKDAIHITASVGDTVKLSCKGSSDPDGNSTTGYWTIYNEAGSFKGRVTVNRAMGKETSLTIPKPTGTSPKKQTIHVILTLEDTGSPSLVSYRRIVITVEQ